MTFGPPETVWATLLVKSRVPRVQLVLVMVPALESTVVVPAALQFQVGDVLKLASHGVGSTSTAGGIGICVQGVHVPETHRVPLAHACPAPHPPQLLLSVWKLRHAPEQALRPLVHVKPHTLDVHVAVALLTAGQTCPHEPQLPVSVASFTQSDPQGE
jgi:hypothetical protein